MIQIIKSKLYRVENTFATFKQNSPMLLKSQSDKEISGKYHVKCRLFSVHVEWCFIQNAVASVKIGFTCAVINEMAPLYRIVI